MIEKKFFQSEWHGIRFTNLGIPLRVDKLAGNEFYDAFYQTFFDKYTAFDELPIAWCTEKQNIANALSHFIPDNTRVLSFGCGIGYLEVMLKKQRQDIDLTAFDFAENASEWLRNSEYQVDFTTSLENTGLFDFIYICQVFYAFNFADSVHQLKALRSLLSPEGKVFIIYTSILPDENSDNANKPDEIYKPSIIKNLLRPSYLQIRKLLFGNDRQFWGWERDNSRMQEIAEKAGYSIDGITYAAGQSIIQLKTVA